MRCVHGRSCQGLIECLYMTSSCRGLGCTLGKVENNERRTAAKHNRIHLYLPTAACLYVCVCCSHARYNTNTNTHTEAGYWGTGQVQLQLDMKARFIVVSDYAPVNQHIHTECFCKDGCLICFQNKM